MPKLPESSMDYSEILRLAQTDAGRQLIALVQKQGGQQLNSAMQQASEGDYRQLQQTVREFLRTPEAKALAEKLRR